MECLRPRSPLGSALEAVRAAQEPFDRVCKTCACLGWERLVRRDQLESGVQPRKVGRQLRPERAELPHVAEEGGAA
eukprot:scaffold193993_cov35-Tisochrysis_lutea.AAC.1